jgi:hypothetical protein
MGPIMGTRGAFNLVQSTMKRSRDGEHQKTKYLTKDSIVEVADKAPRVSQLDTHPCPFSDGADGQSQLQLRRED